MEELSRSFPDDWLFKWKGFGWRVDATHNGRELDVNEVVQLCFVDEVKNVWDFSIAVGEILESLLALDDLALDRI